MKILNKAILFLSFGHLLLANSTTIETKEKFCQSNPAKDTIEFCMEIESKYPVISHSNKVLEKHMNERIEKELFAKGLAREYVEKHLKDGVASAMGHEETLLIEVLSQFKKSFTLEVNSYAYLGGAHGMGATQLLNYDAQTGKKIKIEDLFLKNYKEKLRTVAEKVYRDKHHLKATDSLKDKKGWFDDEFTLSNVIGIGNEGLHLEYNSYDVQPYAAGTISLVLKYELLKEIINPNSYLSSMIETKKLFINKSSIYTFEDKLFGFTVEAKKVASDKLELTLNAKNHNGDSKEKSAVSLSFPQLSQKSDVLKKTNKGFKKLSLYPSKSKIYNFDKKKSIESQYLLVEAETNDWKFHKTKSIKLTVKIPDNSDEFIIDLRATTIENKKILTTPFDGIKGQQGSYNYQIKLAL